MRVLVILLLVQIVGILGSIDAPEPDEIETETDAKEFRRIRKMQAFVELATKFWTREKSRESTILGRMKCRAEGGLVAENAALESMEIYADALRALKNETLRQLEADSNELQGQLDSAAETICRWIWKKHDLSRTFITSFKRCWSLEELTNINRLENISTAVLQYICHNKTNRLSEFLAADGAECLSSTSFGFPCIKKTLRPNNPTKMSVRRPSHQSNFPWSIPKGPLTAQDCHQYESLQQCIVGSMKSCKNPAPSYEVNSVLNIVMKLFGCEDLLKAQTPPAPNNYNKV